MSCMKCGRETAGDQAFCEECRLEMQKYPVKPGTVVLLPNRRETHTVKKPPKRRNLSPEEQVKILKNRVRAFGIALLVCIAIILLLAYPALKSLQADNFKIGQNYTAIVTANPLPESSQTAD